jgi:mannan endo-1,4-beta-mannosidase
MLNRDSFKNLLFSIHMYAQWANQYGDYNIISELQQLKTLKIPLTIGEFASSHPARINGVCMTVYIDVQTLMRECLKHGFGYLGWSWAGNGNDGCGPLGDLDIIANVNWNTHTQFTPWGYELVNLIGFGIAATSTIASVFN